MRNAYTTCVGKLEWKKSLEEVGVYERIILNSISRKWCVGGGLDSFGSS
jgi:hypothetical protein